MTSVTSNIFRAALIFKILFIGHGQVPSPAPSPVPSQPTLRPTRIPTPEPSPGPSEEPSSSPTFTSQPTFTPVPSVSPTPSPYCPSSYRYLHSPLARGCYYVNTTGLTWSEANASCSANGGWLASIGDANENALIFSITVDHTWIGLNQIVHPESWVWTHGTSGYFNWYPGTPAFGQMNKCGVMVGNGYPNYAFTKTADKWWDWQCDALATFVCETSIIGSVVSYPTLEPTKISPCPPGFEYENGQDKVKSTIEDIGGVPTWKGIEGCYHHSKYPLPWALADGTCTAMGGYLVTISGRQENEYIASIAANDVWLGLNSVKNSSKLEWRNDWAYKSHYSKWSKHEPDYKYNENCVILVGRSNTQRELGQGEWSTTTCWGPKDFVCETCKIGQKSCDYKSPPDPIVIDNSLKTWQIIIIVVLGACGCFSCAGIGYLIYRRYKKSDDGDDEGDDDEKL